MVTTKHCCYGVCRSDSRYSDRDHMKDVFFIPFPKPTKDFEKCRRWTKSCRRDNFGPENVSKDTYICSLHFIGGSGPTDLNPDPIPAVFSPEQAEKISRKRKAPKPRSTNSKIRRQSSFDTDQAAEALIQLSSAYDIPSTDSSSHSESELSSPCSPAILKSESSTNLVLNEEITRREHTREAPLLPPEV
ncbi:uncharacterized protein LOC144449712 [Glandiceps talaboti]